MSATYFKPTAVEEVTDGKTLFGVERRPALSITPVRFLCKGGHRAVPPIHADLRGHHIAAF